MQVATSQLRHIPVYALSGEIDHDNAETLRATLERGLDRPDSTCLLIDLKAVSYIDSGGLAAILWTVRRLRDSGWLGVIGPNADIRRLLDIMGLSIDSGLRVFADEAEAERAIEGLSHR